MNKFFPKVKNINTNRLKISNEGVYSISKPEVSKEILNYILSKTGKNIIVLDGTGNVGGDTIRFGLSKNVKKVFTTEINKDNFEILKHNINVYKLNNKISLYNVDFIKFYKILKKKIDVIFIDPPWGGPNYKKKCRLNLYLSKQSIGTIVKDIKKRKICSYIFIKIPFNFNITKFQLESDTKQLEIYSVDNSSVYILFIKC